jgi:hypothetical protein
MTRKNLSAGTLIVLMVLILAACVGGSAKPPHFGFFLKDGAKLVEMQEFSGSPDRGETVGIPSTRDTQPVIIVWHNRIVPQWLQLFSDYGEGEVLGYDTVPKADGLLELQPQSALEPDVYCFVQGDPLGIPYHLATWCFRIDPNAAPGQTPGKGTGGLLWVLLILLAAGAASVYFLMRRGSQRQTAPAGAASPVAPAFCMHCGQPVQAGHKFCQHCGKPLR